MAKRKRKKVDKEQARQRIKKIWPLLKKAYPDAKIALKFVNPLELLISTILSAQCTDVRVNMVTKDLFKKYRKATDWADADLREIEEGIRSTGFFRNKARSIQGACRILARQHGGEVPSSMEALLELPGVARKTANVVLGTAFGLASGVVVDTHVKRLAGRLGWSGQSDPNKIEKELMARIPKDRWILISHQLILHGRAICKSRRPRCAACVLVDLCPSALVED